MASGIELLALAWLTQQPSGQIAYKTSDQSVTSNTVVVNDNALYLPVEASATYLWLAVLDYEGGAPGASDMHFAWSLPSGATMRYAVLAPAVGTPSTVTMAMKTETQTPQAGTDNAGVLEAVLMAGTLAVSTTPGTMQFEWAQNTSSTTATIVHAGSVLAAWRKP